MSADLPVVLLVDDDLIFCEIVEQWCKTLPVRLVVVNSAERCRRWILEHPEPVLVLLDVALGQEDGVELLRSLRQHTAAPIVMLTQSSEVETVVRAMKNGANDYLTKPIEVHQFQAKVLSYLALPLPTEVGQRSRAMMELHRRLNLVARTSVNLLIQGETGAGKEYYARRLHRLSGRSEGPFVVVNCAALTEPHQNAEMFGHERSVGETVAVRPGRVEQAHGGTLFLDQVGELSLGLQARLLRVLQEGCFFRVGGAEEVRVDVRVISATNLDLRAAVRQNLFREDLYFRLNTFELRVPPLREHLEDVMEYAEQFRKEFFDRYQNPGFAPEVAAMLTAYQWPGNLRELRNVIERACILATGRMVEGEDVEDPMIRLEPTLPVDDLRSSERTEREKILRAITDSKHNLSEAMRQLGIPRTSFYRKLKRYGIEP